MPVRSRDTNRGNRERSVEKRRTAINGLVCARGVCCLPAARPMAHVACRVLHAAVTHTVYSQAFVKRLFIVSVNCQAAHSLNAAEKEDAELAVRMVSAWCMSACVCVCVRACVHAWVCVRVRVLCAW